MVTQKFSFPILTHPGGNSTSGDRGNGRQPFDIIENNADILMVRYKVEVC
ncbi:MAG: hypothetical protein IM486_20445 [Microcystis sp. M114S2]|nr:MULTISPECIES: hypothetical protein [Microcystis]MDJ0527513.1 hypothetical protein [Microcystis sp. M53600_WE12]NCR74811.1 hypothetical protein [Microcystis aeruginosa K13-06]MCA2666187.1 hypothetical protein [Microcystis sp. M045S2]MCA2712778.1 hypothetical protein [Microcystis sp. M172S2]MCA2806313.1 hypothetical protein [Microcystis sp. M114S2]